MKYKIPFDVELCYFQTEITFPYVFSKPYTERNQTLVWAIIFLLLGAVILIRNTSYGTLFLVFSAIAFFNVYDNNNKYQKLKTDYMRRLKEHMIKENNMPKYGTLEFKKECLVFTDDYNETTTNWKDFQEYKVVKSNLLMMRNKEKGDILVLGESEIGRLEFKKVVAFVKTKI